ncbi:unnamed protein product, partial [Meganyctiphanes norvegica]
VQFESLVSETELLCRGESVKVRSGERYESDEYNDIAMLSSTELRNIVRQDLYPNENHELESEDKIISLDDEEYSDINFDIKPMDTLKRPLVYGYSHRLPRSGSSSTIFLNKRLSATCKMPQYNYIQRNFRHETNKIDNKYSTKKENKNFQQTYWDLWLAKKGFGKEQLQVERDYKRDPANHYVCPMDKYSYDPEVLLAQVRHPISLADATFRQYSAYVQSHIHDHFGSMKEITTNSPIGPNDFHGRKDWTISDPELTSENPSKTHKEPCFTSKIPEHTVSDPELTPEHQHAPQSQTNLPFSSEPDLLFGYGSLPRRHPGAAYTPTATSQKYPIKSIVDLPEESKKRNSFQEKRFSGYQNPVYMSTTEIDKMFGVSHSSSASSCIATNPYVPNPWQHLLPLITPPQTPFLGSRSSIVSHERYETPSSEIVSSHSHSSKLSTAHQSPCKSQRTEDMTELHKKKEKKTSLLKKFLGIK